MNVVSKPQTTVSTVVTLVTVGKRTLNTEFSTDCSFNGAEEQGDRQALGVFGSAFSL